MGKQVGIVKLQGTIDNICFYTMNGEYYVRLKSSLKGKRVKKDPAFRRTMEYAGLLAQASKMASAIYRELPEEEKELGVYRKLVGQIMKELKKA